jgi:GntR family transcriptional regulator
MRTVLVDTRLPLYQRLRDDFLNRIAAGEWMLDTPLPGENELAESLGVAIGTVRKALDTLASEGILIRRQGKGTFLRRASFDASLFRFFRHEAEEGVRRVPASQILARRVEPASSDLAEQLRIAPGARTIRLDRLRSIDGQVVLVEQIYLPLARFEALAEHPLEAFGPLLYPLYERLCGQIVTSACETLTVVSAADPEAGHLGVASGTPLVAIERQALDCTQQPLEWRRSCGRGDRFRYRVDIR